MLSWIAAGTSAVVLLAALAGWLAYRHYDQNIARVGNLVLPGHHQPAPSYQAENYLLVGSDHRSGLTPAQLRAANTTFDPGARSDTVMLVHIPADGSKVTVVSLPRDSYVEIPQWTDAAGHVYPAHHDKLNAAFSLGNLPGGNVRLLIATVEDLSGLRIDHYLQIDFPGFVSMVNSLGGIDVCLRQDAHDPESGINLTAGWHHINGTQALSFVRQRYGLPNGDIDRIKRQQFFISAVMKKVTSAGTLLNPLTLSAFLNDATKAITADQGLSALRNVALRLRKVDPAHMQFATLPYTTLNGTRYIGGAAASVVLLDSPRVAALFAGLRDNNKPPAQASSSPRPPAVPLIVAPSSISVQVDNSAGIAGLARRASTDLGNVGFNVVGIGNGTTSTTTSVVRYGPTRADSARTLAAAVPGSVLVADPTLGNTLVLDVGSSYAGAQAVQVGSAPSSAPSAPSAAPAATASPPVVTNAAAADMSCAP